jgi:hypothetical protein
MDSAEWAVLVGAALAIAGVVWWFFPGGKAIPHDHEAMERAERHRHG